MKHYKINSVRPQFKKSVTSKLQLVATIAIGVVVVISLQQIRHALDRGLQYERVYNTCFNAHVTLNGAGEQACGDAQDQTNTEFLCGSNDVAEINNICWVEYK